MHKRPLILIAFLIIGSFIYSQTGPDEFFNRKIGEDRVLIAYPDIVKYMQYLGKNSLRVVTRNEGLSTRGNPMILSFISSEKNIENLEELIRMNSRMANPDRMKRLESRMLIEDGKAFILITGTIHSTEIASSQMMLLLAHRFATGSGGEIENILDNTVLMLMPSINPDGNIMVTEWYEKHIGTEYEGGPLPFLYHHYAGHDTNRDFFMLNLKETKVVNAILHKRYFPQVFLDMHQMGITGPRMFVPPFKDPMNDNLDPVLLRETDLIGSYMAFKLQEKGKKGVASGYGFDAYWPGGSKNTAWYKNVVGILTELASVAIASPVFIDKNELMSSSKGLPEYKKQTNFPDPWEGGWWRLKDIIDYECIAAEALCEVVSANRKSFLQNYVNCGIESIRKGRAGDPKGYIIPGSQIDQTAMMAFIRKMAEGGVRVFRIGRDKVSGGRLISDGSYYIPLAQPYGNFVRLMMEKQVYPEIKYMKEGPVIEPYDAAGWTLPIQMGVQYLEVNTEPAGPGEMEEVSGFTTSAEAPEGQGDLMVIPTGDTGSALVVNRLLRKKVPVFRSTTNGTLCRGDFAINVKNIDRSLIEKVLKDTDVKVRMEEGTDPAGLKELRKPEIAIYQSFLPSMDEGWTRWVLDEFGFDYSVIHNADMKKRNLPGRFDVIIIPDMDREAVVNGKYRGYRGKYYERMPSEYKGGIGKEGIENLVRFVRDGGSVIFLDSSYEIAATDFELPFENILKDKQNRRFYCPGSILKVKIDTEDPIGWGMNEENVLFFSNGPVFRTMMPVNHHIRRRIVSRFKDKGPHLVSGFLKGGEFLDRAVSSAVFDYYKGSVILFAGRIQHRGQTFATFKMLFNALYYSVLN
ncbi:MAG TPA: hypothetical protein ENN40_04050 [Candidatus Aminicenantes bacterium]|nr:hypothetical protein [Candidatus Aminicenantes bacterium]